MIQVYSLQSRMSIKPSTIFIFFCGFLFDIVVFIYIIVVYLDFYGLLVHNKNAHLQASVSDLLLWRTCFHDRFTLRALRRTLTYVHSIVECEYILRKNERNREIMKTMKQWESQRIKESESHLEYTYRKADLHTHTCASGHCTTDTITDMAREASKRQMQVLGISDHGPASQGSAGLSYFRSLTLGERKRFNISLRYGAEANILDSNGHLDIPDDILCTLDYCIISMHRPVYTSGSAIENTKAYIKAMQHPSVKIIGHCDDSRFPVDYRELVKAALSYGILPELNNVSLMPDSYRKDCPENSRQLLRECASFSCPILLSSDSHGKEHIGEVDKALSLISEAEFPMELIRN